MKLKRIVYLGLTMVLGVELMFILHVLLESWYISNFSTALPLWFFVLLMIGGVVGGLFLGKWWWQIVYVEKRHWRFRK